SSGATNTYGANRSARLRTRRGAAGAAGGGAVSGGVGATVVVRRDAMASAARGPGVHLLHGRDELVHVTVPGELGQGLAVLHLDLATDPVVKVVAGGDGG